MVYLEGLHNKLTIELEIALKKNLHFEHTFMQQGERTVRSYSLSRFFDLKYEYLQHLPPMYSPVLMHQSPFHGARGRELIGKIRSVYTSKVLDEPFQNSLEQRKNVRFGILIPFEVAH